MINFFYFSNLNKTVKSTVVLCVSIELLSRDSRAFSQCTSELSGVRASQKDTSAAQAHLTDTNEVLGIILFTQSQNQSLNLCNGSRENYRWQQITLVAKSTLLGPLQLDLGWAEGPIVTLILHANFHSVFYILQTTWFCL